MKKIVTFILLACMVLTFAACGDNGNKSPETTAPETTTPETTAPETTAPETTTPEATTPEATTPEATAPETTAPETTAPETTVPETTAPETTAPETTAPETTAPETTAPEATTPEATTPDITPDDLFEAGQNYAALLGDYDSLSVQATFNGNVLYNVYWCKEYFYSFYDAEYMDLGIDNTSFLTTRGEFSYCNNTYVRCVYLTTNGFVDEKEAFNVIGEFPFISKINPNDGFDITEKDGSIIVTRTCDMDNTYVSDERIVSCVETYVLDAETREINFVTTTYTYDDGTVEEGVVTITRNVEGPEEAETFINFENQTENLRTVNVVFNPGTENEKTEIIQIPKGIYVNFYSDFSIDETPDLYVDEALTQKYVNDSDANADLTVYVVWGE